MGGDAYYRLYGRAGLLAVDGDTAVVNGHLAQKTGARVKLHDRT